SRGISQRDGHAQRHAEVAHGQTEGQSAETPKDAERVGPKNALERSLVNNCEKLRGHGGRKEPRRDNPTEESADEPIRFPGPMLYAAKWNVETARSQTAEPMKENAQSGIGDQGVLKVDSEKKRFFDMGCFDKARSVKQFWRSRVATAINGERHRASLRPPG